MHVFICLKWPRSLNFDFAIGCWSNRMEKYSYFIANLEIDQKLEAIWTAERLRRHSRQNYALETADLRFAKETIDSLRNECDEANERYKKEEQ